MNQTDATRTTYEGWDELTDGELLELWQEWPSVGWESIVPEKLHGRVTPRAIMGDRLAVVANGVPPEYVHSLSELLLFRLNANFRSRSRFGRVVVLGDRAA